MKAYKTTYDNKIIEKDILEFGVKSVFYIDYNGKKASQKIDTEFHKWHKTKEDAIDFLKNRLIERIKNHERYLSSAKQQLLDLENLK